METRPTILLVDDNSHLLEIFELILKAKGLSVTTAQSAEQAIMALEFVRPAAIITDLSMPEMSGIEFINYMRSAPDYADIPIVAVSGLDADHLEEAIQAGATVVFRKPVDFDALADIIGGLYSH